MTLSQEHFAKFILDTLGLAPASASDAILGREALAAQYARRLTAWYSRGLDAVDAAELIKLEHHRQQATAERSAITDALGL